MALTLNDFNGFETGGLEEALATSGSPDATEATVVRSGNRSLLMTGSPAPSYTIDQFALVANAGNDHICGFAFRTDDVTPAISNGIWAGRIASTDTTIGLLHTTDNRLRLLKAGGLSITPGTAQGILKVNTWHYIEIYWQNSDSGNAEVFLNGVSILTETDDFKSGSGNVIDCVLNNSVVGDKIYFDDFYWLSGASSASDRLGNAEVYKYQSSKASVTPDTGSDLDAGDWDECGKTPLDVTTPNAEYTDAGAGSVDSNATDGSPEGPKNDPRITGEIKGMKGISNMKRSGGGATDHFILMGNSVDGTTRSADLDPPTSFANYFFFSESDGIVPNVNEYASIGFEMTNAQDYECQEQWAMLLHVPASITELGIKPPLHDRLFRHHLVR